MPVEAGRIPSVVDLAQAAGWDEREAADLYGVGVAGHNPLRPLVNHTDGWITPVTGSDSYQVAVGPIHAGIIESGHFRFHVVGDRILHVDARLFYKHRGLERACEGQSLADGLRYAARACAACSVTNSVAYAHACEQIRGMVPSGDLARVRTVLLELERVWSHLNDIGAMCAGVGLAAGNTHFAALTDRARHLNATLTGHRFLFGSVLVGGSALECDRATIDAARASLVTLLVGAERGWRELQFHPTFNDRLPGMGTLTVDDAYQLGTLGPAARATGVAEDARGACPRLSYDGFEAVTPPSATGDVRARLEQRMLELRQSFDLLDRLLDGPLVPASAQPGAEPLVLGIGRVESPGAPPCAPSRSTATGGWGACTCEPGPTRTGRRSPTRPPAISSPTSP